MKSLLLSSYLLLALPGLALGQTHMAVQAALDYQLPGNTCSKPKVIPATTLVNAPAQSAGSDNIFAGKLANEITDVDSYTRGRQERKAKRWRSCLAIYKTSLLDDMEELKNSAQYGLSQEQANAILTNMAMIQQVYLTEDGVLEQPE